MIERLQRRSRFGRVISIAALGLAGIAVCASLFLAPSRSERTVTYKNKPLEAWFYGSRTNFFYEQTRRAAQEAFDAVGTNGGAFLLSKLKMARGNGPLYCKLYGILPVWVKSRLPYAISGDDIKSITLQHLRQMTRLSREQVQALADCVPGFRNPRLRMSGFQIMRMKYQADPAFPGLCRKLLDDEQPGIQLEAAIWLGQSALASDPGEPRLFPVLIAGLESKEKRKASADLNGYQYRQQPPGGSGRPSFPRLALVQSMPHEEWLRDEILRALYRLERYLSQEQKDRLRLAEQAARQQNSDTSIRRP
jgi:hypothetical protein